MSVIHSSFLKYFNGRKRIQGDRADRQFYKYYMLQHCDLAECVDSLEEIMYKT